MQASMPSFTRRVFLTTPVGALVSAGSSEWRDEAAWTILRRVQEKYRAATAYDFDLHVDSSSDTVVTLRGGGSRVRMASLAPDCFLYQKPAIPLNSRKQPDYLVCGDGRSVFTFSAFRNHEYIEEVYRDSRGAVRVTEGAKMYRSLHVEYVECFYNLAGRNQKEPRYRGRQRIRVLDKAVDCAVVETYPSDGSPFLITERLWVENGSDLVVRHLRRGYLVEKAVRMRFPKIIASDYHWRVLGEEIAPETFRFVPPKGARFVEKFTPLPPRLIVGRPS